MNAVASEVVCACVDAKQFTSAFQGCHASAAGAARLFARVHARMFQPVVHGKNASGLSLTDSSAAWVASRYLRCAVRTFAFAASRNDRAWWSFVDAST